MHIHFIGIGGIGVSALAQYYLTKGHEVSGSDLTKSEITDLLAKKGAKIYIEEHTGKDITPDIERVVFSPAITKDNPELKKSLELQATNRKLQVLSYPQALGELTKKYFTIAVSGTHGKSTVTSMIGLILTRAGLDPTVIVGTKLEEFGGSNFRMGKSDYLVIEADEWRAAFLNYRPRIIVLTNIEREHLDYYKNLNHILRTYKQYLGHLPPNGFLVTNKETNINPAIAGNVLYFSRSQKEFGKLKKILKVPGEHNILNALAALKVAEILEIPDEVSFQALSNYRGAWRRFEERELKIKNLKLKIISDYGHHPTEILATLKGAREKFKKEKIILVFQPHQHQRTFFLFKEFVRAFQKILDKSFANKIIIADIFDAAGRENQKIRQKVSAQKLVKAVKRKTAVYLPKSEIIGYLEKNLEGGEVVIIMGAGDIYKLVGELSTA